jgi:hypothetical protein
VLSTLARLSDLIDDAPAFFWIDAICIDQENISERNHQVNLMKYIYSQAKRVIVWLGTSREDVQDDIKAALDYLLAWKKADTAERAHQLSHSELQDSLLRMFNRPYWSRLWIIQEVLLAKDIVVFDRCGLCWWKDIFRWFRFLEVFALQNKDGVLRTRNSKTFLPDSSESRSVYTLFEDVLLHVRPFYDNASWSTKFGFAHSVSEMLRIA